MPVVLMLFNRLTNLSSIGSKVRYPLQNLSPCISFLIRTQPQPPVFESLPLVRLSSLNAPCHLLRKMYSWDNLPKPNVVFVLGGPGAGKGTQCSLICKEFGYVHLSAGDLLRKEQTTPDSEFGPLIDEHIRNGTIVPVKITCSLLENAMLEHMKLLAENAGGDDDIPAGNFLIDGFPRNQDNLDGWKSQVDKKVNLKFVIVFDCPQEASIKRCLKRGQHSGRADDNIESMQKRLDTHHNQTMPIVEYYNKLGLVKCVDSNRTISQVFGDVRKLFS